MLNIGLHGTPTGWNRKESLMHLNSVDNVANLQWWLFRCPPLSNVGVKWQISPLICLAPPTQMDGSSSWVSRATLWSNIMDGDGVGGLICDSSAFIGNASGYSGSVDDIQSVNTIELMVIRVGFLEVGLNPIIVEGDSSCTVRGALST